MSHPSPEPDFPSLLNLFLEEGKNREKEPVLKMFTDYLLHLYEGEDEILMEDVSGFEVDDFLNFYIQDRYPDRSETLIREARSALKSFQKFLIQKKYLTSEDLEEWKEALK
ncbi:MAG: hypothetical protein H7A24_16065 [Leptospiraceae bacterium]|nr:hypothetical protein [Leptospiraceae bacterium]MCP5513403.1 hypothetical protein [Leptospiraceae bacterium]